MVKKIKLAVGVGILVVGSILITNTLIPKRKTVDSYVKCFNDLSIMSRIHYLNNPYEGKDLSEFKVTFNPYKVTEKEVTEFMKNSEYEFEKVYADRANIVLQIKAGVRTDPFDLKARLGLCFSSNEGAIKTIEWKVRE